MVRFKAYLQVLRRPRVLTLFTSSLVGRAAYAFVLLPLFFATQHSGGSVASAGIAVGVYSAGAGLLAPARASLIDHFGSRKVLGILVISYGGILAMLTLAGAASVPSWGFIALAGAAGVAAPPLGPTMRVAWSALLENQDDRKTGLSLDATVEELLYVAGPVVAGLLLGLFAPWQVFLVPTVLALTGGLLFVRSLSVLDTIQLSDRVADPAQGRFLLLDARFVALLVPALVAGGISGLLDIVVPALSDQMGGPAAVGIVLGVFSVGSVVGGLLYGVMRFPWSTTRQLFSACVLLIVTTSIIAWLSDPVSLGAALGVAGLFMSPVMVAAYMAAPARASARRSNAATTWVNSSYNLGSAGGSAITGVLIEHVGSAQSVLAVCCALLCLVVVGAVVSTGNENGDDDGCERTGVA